MVSDTYLLTYLLTHSFTHLLTHSLTYSLTHTVGGLDYHSVHAACPVKGNDEKWAANKWIWTDKWSISY